MHFRVNLCIYLIYPLSTLILIRRTNNDMQFIPITPAPHSSAITTCSRRDYTARGSVLSSLTSAELCVPTFCCGRIKKYKVLTSSDEDSTVFSSVKPATMSIIMPLLPRLPSPLEFCLVVNNGGLKMIPFLAFAANLVRMRSRELSLWRSDDVRKCEK